MFLPDNIKSVLIQTMEENYKKLKTTKFSFDITSKTPQKITNQNDFVFGLYLGALKKTLINHCETKLQRNITDTEHDEIDHIIIDYQDKMGELIFK